MLRVGLTGGIGCGKTTVANEMRALGCHILEADEIAHRVTKPGTPAYQEIVREFGAEIVSDDGCLDRPRLGAIVFNDPQRLARLNAIVHPAVLAQEDREFRRLEGMDPSGVAVVVAALIIEAGFHERLDRLLVAWCTPEQQLARLTDAQNGRGLTIEDAKRRIASQMDMNEKRKLATDEIDCSGSLEHTHEQVAELVERLHALAAQPH